MKIKICGLTRKEDVRLALQLKVDLLGFQMSLGPRKITAQRAKALVAAVRGKAITVGVFVKESPSEITRLTRFCGFDMVQWHGSAAPWWAKDFFRPVLGVVRMRKATSAHPARRWPVAAVLLDSYNKKQKGGTGMVFPWKWAWTVTKENLYPVFLAGGLNPENVMHAVRRVRPFGVDVASGVEESPGIKSAARMRWFVQRARKASGG